MCGWNLAVKHSHIAASYSRTEWKHTEMSAQAKGKLSYFLAFLKISIQHQFYVITFWLCFYYYVDPRAQLFPGIGLS